MYTHPVTKPLSRSFPLPRTAASVLLAVPPVIFYAILSCHIVNLPNTDDYDALLNYANHWAELRSVSAKLLLLLSNQHNEYKLFFAHAFVWVECALTGHIDFRWICAIGNAFVLLIAITLWKMFLPRQSLSVRAALFLPVSCLLFQLNYVETLDQAMQGLQNIPVIFFSLSAIYSLCRDRRSFIAALCFMVLAIASSGNGLFLIPIGILFLAIRRLIWPLVVWLATSTASIAAYSYQYHRASLPSASGHNMSVPMLFLSKALYLIAFIGSAIGVRFEAGGLVPGVFKLASLTLGIAICLVLAWLAKRDYFKCNPAVGYCVLFLLMTSLGVAGIRSQLGIFYSQSSRYRIYSDLLIIFSWFGIAEVVLIPPMKSLLRDTFYLIAVTVTATFCIGMDLYGLSRLRSQNYEDIQGMKVYEHADEYPGLTGPVLPSLDATEEHRQFRIRARAELDRSINLGLYEPPVY